MITVIGEALIDLVPTSDDTTVRAFPGGSPLNIAIGAARLGYPTALMARLSRDPFGRLLHRHATRNGVDLSAAPEADEPSTIAVAHGNLYFSGAADWQWTSAELAWIPATTTVVHIGSLACCLAPGATRVLRAASRLRKGGALVCIDLNMRPEVMGTPGRGRLLMQRPLRSADVIRASVEDIGWLYPGRPPEAVAEHWLELGADLVVITRGAKGAMAIRGSGYVLHRPAYPAKVIDTAGADDAFTAAILGGLHQLRQAGHTLREVSSRDLADVMDTASVVAGMTCERPGADPPTAAELSRRRLAWPGTDGSFPVPRDPQDLHVRDPDLVADAAGHSCIINGHRRNISGSLTHAFLRSCYRTQRWRR
jgi:fructokinase